MIGIIVSFLLGDVPASILLVGTSSSAVTGVIGGVAGKLFVRSAVVSVVAFALAGSPRDATAQTPKTHARATPAANVKDFEWLVGRWEGKMTKAPGVADVVFAPPAAGLMTGVMRPRLYTCCT